MSYILINTGGLVIVAFLLFLLWWWSRDIWSCANVLSVSFGFPLLGSQLWFRLTESSYFLTSETLLLLYTGWIAFLLGVAITIRRWPPQSEYATIITPVGRHGRLVLVALMLAHMAYTVAVIHSTGLVGIFQTKQFGTIDSFAALRLNASSGNSTAKVGWYLEAWHIAFAYYVPLAIFLYRQREISRKILLFVWSFAGVSSLVMFSRVQLMLALVFGLVTWAVLFQASGWKVLRVAATLLFASIALFVGMQTVLSRLDSQNKTQLNDQLATYIVSSPLCFQELLNGNYHEDNPHQALYIGTGVYYVLGKLALLDAAEYPIGYRAFVYVPHPSNVYTFLDVFALDFGTVGIILGPFVMGMCMAWVYNHLRTRITYPRVLLYALCVYTCSISNLANFILTPAALIFLGTVLLLWPLLLADTRSGPIISRA